MMCGKQVSTGAVLALFIGVMFLSTQQVSAQYFGQNKVVYQSFDFKVLKTDHFDIYYYTGEERAINDAARMAERWYARYAKYLGFDLQGRQPLIMYASGPQFSQTNVVGGSLGEGTGGVTESSKRRMVLPFAGPYKETDHVIGHELVHAFQYSLSGIQPGRPARPNSPAAKLPLWFVEGMAEYLSVGPDDPLTAMWMRDAVKNSKKLPSIRQLEDPRYFPYRWGQSLLAYIAGRWGDTALVNLFNTGMNSGDINAAIRNILVIGPDTLAKDWHKALHDTYDPYKESTKSADAYGRELIGPKRGGGELNIGPVVSPDGKSMIFFSEKSLFAVNLYLADVETGKVKKTLVRTELDPHFSSLEFINSAGAWSSDGKQIVFTAVVGSRPALTIYDVDRDRKVREIKLPTLDEAFNPTWSPDGNSIAFSGQTGGVTDLFVYDLRGDKLERLTDDAYADIQPAWSPDGKQIAFVTDRFGTDLANLSYGRYEIGLLQPDSKQITPVHMFERGKVINPQWSPDGNDLYVISDHTGIPNIYRHSLRDNATTAVTNLYSGVSGITSISPAMSIASGTGRLVYSAYDSSHYVINLIESPGTLSETPQVAATGSASMLPPIERSSTTLVDLQRDPNFGLPATQTFTAKPYHAGLSVDYVGQPYIAAGIDPLGTQLGGGVGVLWSDMLGDHTLATAVQLQTDGGFTDFGALLGYQNTKRRWNWGGVVQQVPYTLTQYNSGYAVTGGDTVYIEQQLSYRQMNREVAAIVSYPFDRVKRVDFTAGFANIQFEQKLETRTFDPFSGQMLTDQKENLPALNGITIGQASGAFVFDNAIYGATSPLLGQRAHFEVQPTFGTLTFYSLIGDIRKYFMPVRPFTLAFRVMHYGRYGKSAEDNRLTPVFIGYQDLVRGYNSGSFSASECQGDTNCPRFDQLFGSKMAVANFELRFPLFGALHLGSGFYGVLPVEAGVFYDAGVAWSEGEKPFFLDSNGRKAVRSYGALLRGNVLGYLIVELDYVKPVDRQEKGSYWQFNISPGF